MEDELAQLRRSLRAANRELSRASDRPERERQRVERAESRGDEARERLERVRRRRRRARPRANPAAAPPNPERLAPGDVVYLRGVTEPAELLSGLSGETLEVRLGSLRTRVRPEQIERVGRTAETAVEPQARGKRPPPPPDPGARCDVRGRTTDDAVPTVEGFLDRAYRAGRQRLEIVHGKGTGALRQAVRAQLQDHPLISSYETAAKHEGGDGVTVVHLVS